MALRFVTLTTMLGGRAMANWAVGMTREKGERGNEEEDSMDQREGISLLE